LAVWLQSVAIIAYALDSYPTSPGEVSGLINLSRILGGFAVPYFQMSWGVADGYSVSFGVEAAIIAAASCVSYIYTHLQRKDESLEALAG
jgi:hypothetical protein